MTRAPLLGVLIAAFAALAPLSPVAAQPETDGDAPESEAVAAPAAAELDVSVDPTEEPPAAADADSMTADGAVTPATARLADPRVRARVASDAPEDVVLDSVDEEAPAPATGDALSAGAEVAIRISPSVGFGLAGAAGALGALGAFSVGGGTDFVFATDARVFLGLGLGISHSEAGGVSTSNLIDIPLIAQIYLDTPRRGAAVPTLRVIPAFHWESQTGPAISTREAFGGRLTLGVGMTWFVIDWLAIRLLGDIGVSATATYLGTEAQTFNAYVGADVGIVVRL